MSEERRIVLITGASSGIGAELAQIFAREGHDLGLVARREDRLETLADKIAAQGAPRPLVFPCDLAQPDAVASLGKAVAAAGARPIMLVNNAGFGLLGEVATIDPDAQLAIIDVNTRALLALTLHFLPQIREARGKILNVASVVAFLPGGPRLAVYYASKAFVLSFSRSLREEMRADGVEVCVLCPGMTPTEFQERAGFGPGIALDWMPQISAVQVAEAGYAGLMTGRGVITPGFFNKLTEWLAPLLPTSLVLPLIGAMQRKR
ncbi:SDR family NAD(P)-dependent oxidoreductase [Beijerinckia indica]|uniref:Short-chain dehydrogenase/reductase SDR n=1 Tax=Beijerinckia indica subsp. indica (strain ATCC 9039 / DSM 1715 / NCIMB 8712) TaxID=395963 RepID=B2ID39_BEII9|nr:SDR family oxidoreductase [Beijerinckia indica]ACB96804.1 short-chain dehydrogenase/reductase SDR [Beijerinckia indica subsp. indica ATCC 9039]